MADHPIIMEGKQFSMNVRMPGQGQGQGHGSQPTRESVVKQAPNVSDPKMTVGQRLTKYAFGDKADGFSNAGEYILKSYLEPTGKRVANDMVETLLLTLKHMFQRWLFNGQIHDDNNWVDRTSYSNYSKKEPIKAMVTLSPVKELTFSTLGDARNVLNKLKETIKNESANGAGCVTVRDYYELSGQPGLCESGISSTSGWKNLDKVEIAEQPDGSGYILKLPKPIDLKQ